MSYLISSRNEQFKPIRSNSTNLNSSARRPIRTLILLRWAIGALFLKVLLSNLSQYPDYVPPNFRAPFLLGREGTFFGVYAVAFYIHILVGPVVACLCFAQMSAKLLRKMPRLHRVTGRVLMLLTLVGLLPSGLVMAAYTQGGTVAYWGFVSHISATAYFAIATWLAGRMRDLAAHRRHAVRSTILLLSPLLLRVIVGGADLLRIDPASTYQAVVWCSWSVPLVLYEAGRRMKLAKGKTCNARPINETALR